MSKITPDQIPFRIKDDGFYLDGRLTAIVDGSAYDFMGREIFTVGYFRENIGFGIINVDIELNTNLQPIITITLKDLYGNTMFGKSETAEKANYRVLFNWPPPKFLYTFKGYLGSQVTWLLTLKSTAVTYQSDGSYDIKCEFVPNQWGFMADLPFMFLLATKGLRKRELSDAEFKQVRSIFDLIKIGRKIEVKSKEISSEFDILQQQMTLLKSNRIVEALAYSRVIKFDEPIDGTFGKSKIISSGGLNFTTITIKTPKAPIETIEKLKAYTSANVESLRKVNTYLLLNADFAGVPPENVSLSEINFDSGGFMEDKIKKRIDIINNNLKIIQDTIKDRIYKASKSQLRQITIGEIFQQLAKDSGYLMGRILKAGEEGYLNNTDRDAAVESQKIINKHYPLVIRGKEKEEVPCEEYGVKDYEMAFVNEFITAISEGVAKDLIQTSPGAPSENNLIKRVNNVEGPKDNPYKPFLRNIAQNVMVRAGIIAYLTRSNDPNYPGDYENNFTIFGFDTGIGNPIDRDSVEEVIELATSDMENITTQMLSELDEIEAIKLKQFCTFWKNFSSDDGEYFLKQDGTVGFDGSIPRTGFGGAVSNDVRTRQVIVDNSTKSTKTFNEIYAMAFGSFGDSGNSNSGSVPSETIIDTSNYQFIDSGSFQSQIIYNNGILYRVPVTNQSSDDYTFVLFEGTDSTKVRSVTSSNSDGEARNSDADESGSLLGYVPIDTYNGTDGNKLPRIEFMEERVAVSLLKYSQMSNPDRGAWGDEDSWMRTCVYPTDTQFVNPNSIPSGDPEKQIVTSNITVSVAFHPDTNDLGLVFGPFYDSNSGLNHLACIKKMCVIILDKFQTLEAEKNKVVSNILGQAEEGKNAIYKQFNILYHQWETLLFKDSDNLSSTRTFTRLGPEEIVTNLEDRFGSDNQHRSPMSGDRKNDVSGYNSSTFVYDYPLNNTAKLNVKNALINIDPLYTSDSNTTVLNIIQQVCEKNNFMFIPIPGNGDFHDCAKIFEPQITHEVTLKNLFYIMFAPTPESRTKLDNSEKATLSQSVEANFTGDVIEVQVGSVYNKIFKSIDIETYENKPTAESIVNLQRLTDNENQNKKVTTDCSLLPVMEGRSCKTTFEMLGNAQIFPMQYFYLNSIPLFDGLYQILKVNHSITPNDMTTKAQGVRMRFAPGNSGGIQPITLETFENKDVEIEELQSSALKERDAATNRPPIPLPTDSDPVNSGGGGGGGNANTLDQCTPVAGELNESVIKSTLVKNEYGGYIQGKTSFISKIEKAYNTLKAQGITLKIGDSYRNFNTQKAAYEKYQQNLELYKQGKSWEKNGKTYPPSKKPDNIAKPCNGYHVRGQAIDLAQSSSQKSDIQSHGKIYKALYDAGLRRIGNEWWHWSVGEAQHEINKRFTDHGGDSANFTKY